MGHFGGGAFFFVSEMVEFTPIFGVCICKSLPSTLTLVMLVIIHTRLPFFCTKLETSTSA